MRRKAMLVCTFLLISAFTAGAATYKTLQNFDFWYGSTPYAGLTFDQAGNLYGVTAYGGGDYTDGMVFKLSPSPAGWKYQVLYEFNFEDFYDPIGRVPIGGVVIDEAGNIYGTNTFTDDDWECGTVFKGAPGSEWIPIHTFTFSDGCTPQSNLRYDNGWLVGTTSGGGTHGQGTLFVLDTSGANFYSYSFEGTEGTNPAGGLNSFSYGTTVSGGMTGEGNVYRLDPNNRIIRKHSFKLDGQAGYAPMGDLLTGSVGPVRTMYGTTSAGGKGGGGTVYQLTENQSKPDRWILTTLHSFSGPDGSNSLAGLTADSAGDLYGTTSQGGDWGCGTVFKLSPILGNKWKFTVLYSFNPNSEDSGGDGCNPASGLVLDSAGNLYGTTMQGGWYGWGTVYEITP